MFWNPASGQYTPGRSQWCLGCGVHQMNRSAGGRARARRARAASSAANLPFEARPGERRLRPSGGPGRPRALPWHSGCESCCQNLGFSSPARVFAALAEHGDLPAFLARQGECTHTYAGDVQQFGKQAVAAWGGAASLSRPTYRSAIAAQPARLNDSTGVTINPSNNEWPPRSKICPHPLPINYRARRGH